MSLKRFLRFTLGLKELLKNKVDVRNVSTFSKAYTFFLIYEA